MIIINKLIMVNFQAGKRLQDGTTELLGFQICNIINDMGQRQTATVPKVCTQKEREEYYKTGYFNGRKAEGL
jgi:hypothetical protein